MNFKTCCLPFLLFWALLSCNNSGSTSDSKGDTSASFNSTANTPAKPDNADTLTPKDLEKLRILYNVFNRSADSLTGDEDLGREVDMDAALQCIGIYRPEMYKHGIERSRRTRTIGTITTRVITESEIFGGKNFVEYITKVVRMLDPEGLGENMEFQLQLGIYTDSFLQTYFPDNATMRASKKDRITIFVIPVAKGTFQFKKTTDDDIKAYELGGLQP